MAYLDPYGGTGPRGREREDEPPGREWQGGPPGWEREDGSPGWTREREARRWQGHDANTGTPVRAWHGGAAPAAYSWAGSHSPTQPRDDQRYPSGTGPGWPAAGGPEYYPGPAAPQTGGYGQPQPGGYGQQQPQPGGLEHQHLVGGYGQHHGVSGYQYQRGAPGTVDPDAPYPEAGLPPIVDPVAEADTAVLPAVDADPVRPPGRVRGRRRASRRKANPGGRAGRDLPAAIGVGLALAALILVPLFLFRPAFLAVVAAAVGVGIWELARAVNARDAHPPLVPLVLGGLLMTGLAWQAGADGLSLGLLVTVLAAMVWRLADGPAGYQRDLVVTALIAVYVPFLAGFAVLLAVPPDGDWRVLATLAAVVLSDTGGYVVGVLAGKHPMAPSVSPKKSWEGFAGSVGAAAIGSAVLLIVVLDVELWWGALFGLAVSVAAVLGDLCESMIKRDLGVKDMSDLLPGHGGLMDRLDSVLFAVPTAYLLLSAIAPPS